MVGSKKNTIVLAVGGSGGHIFPAAECARDFEKQGYEVLFMGKGLALNPFFDRKAFAFIDIPSAAPIVKHPLKAGKAIAQIIKGWAQALLYFKKNPPLVVIGFGSYHSLPVLLATVCMKIPYALFEANAILGRVNRLMGKKALCVAQALFDISTHPKLPLVKVNMPLRYHRVDKAEALAYYGLSQEKKTLLIFGGSQGARNLNFLILEAIKLLNTPAHKIQVLHLIGSSTPQEEIEKAYRFLDISACVQVFETQMSYAWSVADIVIARSGASTVAEQLFFQVPAIYIPYPYAADDHQYYNADFIERTLKGARVLRESELSAHQLSHYLDVWLLDKNKFLDVKQRLQSFGASYEAHSLSETILTTLKTKRII